MSRIIPKLDNMSNIFDKYKKIYDIKFCDVDEIDDVILFIDTYWKKDHILVKSRKLMDWQHLDKNKNRYNFVIARHKVTGEIHSILGFITTKFFDPEIEKILLWGVIWKTRDDIKAFGLGIMMYYYLKISFDIETICLSGISEDGKRNYESLGFFTGKEGQYFFPNPIIQDFRIAKGIGVDYQKDYLENELGWTLRKIEMPEFDLLEKESECFNSRYKTKAYYKARYFTHPIYHYDFFVLEYQGSIKSIMILRECHANDGQCVRLVEYVGDYNYLANVKGSISSLLKENSYEYLDLVLTGVDEKILVDGGFINIHSDLELIIPNYFEPYLDKKIDIGYAYISTDPNLELVITKGDADQDRPNIV